MRRSTRQSASRLVSRTNSSAAVYYCCCTYNCCCCCTVCFSCGLSKLEPHPPLLLRNVFSFFSSTSLVSCRATGQNRAKSGKIAPLWRTLPLRRIVESSSNHRRIIITRVSCKSGGHGIEGASYIEPVGRSHFQLVPGVVVDVERTPSRAAPGSRLS